ncbi:hypothetical protein ABTX61_32985 [Amycolatopsis japonica]|uniref:hypothetical protein n=1 Tax=Amycolatopsis japonica TaxID=208439 RepID=UPI0033191E94
MTETTPPLPALNDLSAREEELIEAARSGSVLVCSHLTAHILVASTMTEHQIRADVIRELLLGYHGQLDPRGIRVRGALIVGQLDLNYIDTAVGLELVGCTFDRSITTRGARLPRLTLAFSRIVALNAADLRLEGNMNLDYVRLNGRNAKIQLSDARIGGRLVCRQLHAVYANGPAMAPFVCVWTATSC